jgi:hypothetical protein
MRSLGLALVLTLWAAASARAADSAVFPVQGTNLSDGELAAIGALFTSAYAAQSHALVLGPIDVLPVLQRTASETDSARELGLHEYIHIEAVRLESRIALHASLRNRYGSELFQVRTTAMSLDDVEVVSERMAGALFRRTPLEYTRDVYNVTGKEARANNHLFLEKIFGARFGMTVLVARHLQAETALVAQFDARLEQPDYFLELGLGFLVASERDRNNSLGGLIAQLGASYYLTHGSVAPYIGAGISPRIYMSDYEGPGLAIDGQLGVMFMRESSTRLYAELQVAQNLISVKDNAYDSFASNGSPAHLQPVLPTEFTLAVGVGF